MNGIRFGSIAPTVWNLLAKIALSVPICSSIKICLPIFGFSLLAAAQVFSQNASNVLLVINESSASSLEVGEYYAQKKGILRENILRLTTQTSEQIERQEFERSIEKPVAEWLTRNSMQDRILYIVLTKGIPLRIEGTSGLRGTSASVDSELTLLYRKMAGHPIAREGRVLNPYFLNESPVSQAKPFTHERYDVYLVSRLDGYDSADIRKLIDHGNEPAKEGKILLDGKSDTSEKGDLWLNRAAEILKEMGFGDRTILDLKADALTDQSGILGYYSWGSNDPAIKKRHLNLGFVPGSLAAMYVSSDARTLKEPPSDWMVGTWEDASTHYEGSPQSLSGDLIRDGVTGIAGHVGEPYLEATIRPDILFPAYMSGFSLIEAFYLSMPYLSWQTVVIGDPLCAPFRQKSLAAPLIDKGIDWDTELPAWFSARRLALAAASAFQQDGVSLDAVKLCLRAEVRLAKQDRGGARKILEEVTEKESRFSRAQLLLAMIYDQVAEYGMAVELYRRLHEILPDNPLVLNNLAFGLAVHKRSPQEALPLAERAYALSKGNPDIADTTGWIHHLLGDNTKASHYISEAVNGEENNAEFHFHAAIVQSALGQVDSAKKELARAVSLNPKLRDYADFKELKTKLEDK
jgi:uncharacterized protein (TIGR03790 family)